MNKHTNEEIEIDLVEIFYLVKHQLWIIILSGIICASLAGLMSSFLLTPMYTSRTQLYILSKSTSITSLADIQIGTQLTQDYMVLVKSRPVVNQVIENLDLNMRYEEMLDYISISNPTNTRILEIRVEYPDAYLAKEIVDEFATVSTSQIAKIMDVQQPTIVEEGYMQPNPSSPNTTRNIMIGGLLGVFLAAGIIIVLYLLDDTIKDADDIEKYLELTNLGLIPIDASGVKQSEQDKKKKKRQKKVLARKGKR